MPFPCLRPLACAGLATLVAACSSGSPRLTEAQQRERYASYAQAPVDSFTWLGRFYDWQTLGDKQLVVFTTPSDAYLLTVQSPCNQLPFAQTVGVTATAGTVHARLDSLTVQGWHCPIAQIRPVDYARMRAEQRSRGGQGQEQRLAVAARLQREQVRVAAVQLHELLVACRARRCGRCRGPRSGRPCAPWRSGAR